jgi:hypothetical protein
VSERNCCETVLSLWFELLQRKKRAEFAVRQNDLVLERRVNQGATERVVRERWLAHSSVRDQN